MRKLVVLAALMFLIAALIAPQANAGALRRTGTELWNGANWSGRHLVGQFESHKLYGANGKDVIDPYKHKVVKENGSVRWLLGRIPGQFGRTPLYNAHGLPLLNREGKRAYDRGSTRVALVRTAHALYRAAF